MILEDSVVTWRKWTSPFTSPVWLSMFVICSSFVVVHAVSIRPRESKRFRVRISSTEAMFTVCTLLLRQSPSNSPKSSRFSVILPLQVLFTFFVILIMNLYEGIMTTNISSPLQPKTFQTLGELLDAGYKFVFPNDNITEYYVKTNWSEFVSGFSNAGQFWRYNTRFIAIGRTGSYHKLILGDTENKLKLATDMPYDQEWKQAFFLRPKYCSMVKEPYFTRIFKFRFARRMTGFFAREMIKLWQAGLLEIWRRHYTSEKFQGWLKYRLKKEIEDKSYISIKTGIDTVFTMCGILLNIALFSLIVEKHVTTKFCQLRENLVRKLKL